MIDEYPIEHPSEKARKAFEAIVQDMHKLYDYKITDEEAYEAAQNLAEFAKIVIEINKKNRWHPS